jgi:hypothetical protein
MKPIVFGAVLGLLVAYQALASVVMAVAVTLVAAVVSQPPVLAVVAGVVLWPRVSRRMRRWAR